MLKHYINVVLSMALVCTGVVATAETKQLPVRTSAIPLTTDGVPHVQIGVEPDAEISKELLRLVSNIPDVEIRETVISSPGAKGFWLDEDVALARPDVIVGGREFAHIHPDGSLHASLSPELAVQAAEAGPTGVCRTTNFGMQPGSRRPPGRDWFANWSRTRPPTRRGAEGIHRVHG